MSVYAEVNESIIVYNHQLNEGFISHGSKFETITSIPSSYTNQSFKPISCIIGLIKLKVNAYLIIADDHEVEGKILNDSVAKITSYKILTLNKSLPTNAPDETEYLKLIKEQLDKNEFYFALNNSFDLTNNLQAQFTTKSISSNPEFWWNKYLCDTLIDFNVSSKFVTPIINGYFKSSVINFSNGHQFNYILITRKSSARVGTRYFRRGVDSDGNVANFNETEQVIITNTDQLLSFLQIRGSVPIYWCEINNLRYKPNLIVSTKNSSDATAKHFSKLVNNYGEIYCINLVNNKGYELPVKQGFENAVERLPENLKEAVHYIYFDFHHECKNMKFENASKLIPILNGLGFDDSNYFHYDLKSNNVVNLQKKCIRTNCMDCLDRTNVVQSIFSRWILQKQFASLSFLEYSIPWNQVDPKFNFIFQNMWADNADVVSKSYSSTPALKTDFTRLGKRTIKGSLQDLNNSIMRYYNNNLKDGVRQDSFDLFLGRFKPFEQLNNPFIDYRPHYIQLLPYLLTTSVLILLSICLYPKGPFLSFKKLLTVSLCVFFQFKLIKFIFGNSYQFVNWPTLNNVDFLNKLMVTDSNGKIIGIRYDHNKDFKIESKKSN